MYIKWNKLLALFVTIFSFTESCVAVDSWLTNGTVRYEICNESLAFSVAYGPSIGKCYSDCEFHSNCKMIMYYNGLKQCAFFDTTHLNFSVNVSVDVNFNTTGNATGNANNSRPHCPYVTVSNQNIHYCKQGERFDDTGDRCVASECDTPDEIPNARLLSNSIQIGLSNRYMCKRGFRGIGNPKITCLANRTWTATDFRCQTIYCDSLRIENITKIQVGTTDRNCTANSYHIEAESERIINTEVKYECLTGHVPLGPLEIICQQNATWSNTNVSCTSYVCRDPNEIINAMIINTIRPPYTVGTKLTYTCATDYHGNVAYVNLTCGENDWTPERVDCCNNISIYFDGKCYEIHNISSVDNKTLEGAKEQCLSKGFKMGSVNSTLLVALQGVYERWLYPEKYITLLNEHQNCSTCFFPADDEWKGGKPSNVSINDCLLYSTYLQYSILNCEGLGKSSDVGFLCEYLPPLI